MDIMIILQVIVLFGAIFLGVKLGGMGIGYAGGLGVVVLALVLGMKPGSIPWDVILIIMSVIAAITAMQMAGGLDYLVQIAEKLLRKNPKYINYLAPTVTYFLTIFAGTGHTAFSMIPVIVEVAKGQNIKPAAPLSIAVVASQIAITASPVSAAVVFMSGVLEPLGCSYPMLLAICIPTTFIGCMITSFIVSTFWNLDLDKDPVYQQRLKDGLVKEVKGAEYKEISKSAKTSVAIFLIGVLAVVFYATAISKNVGLIDPVILGRDHAIISFMLTIATLIVIICKVRTDTLVQSSVFKSGMVACVCVLGVAWLGDTFVSGHIEGIKGFASELVGKYPFLLSVALFFASMLLYSQAATAKAIIPAVILALGITPENSGQIYIVVASFAAVSALFVLPTYPTLLGAVQMDDTGTTRIGKYIFNHAFLVPGILAIAISVALGFIVAPMML
ncbi:MULTISPECIES: anaerobic C4-dicarboxylate transporter [Campylobacter]|uniref:C4-dicarboxylate transporter DcuA n=2 Tax=Campylobacter fetus TaxID=196 RepID=A0A5L4VSV7_CAMFE|nr:MULTISPECIES: anaerobic C4-dicarboxylate transporter [Campylobacter]OCS21707.1 C4-dicarboxylate ABC transporter [Campylobacter fetus subsp. venerealis cfvi97/532]OCS25399.1 C4-dicarboxylate ABC transporter [Campylobacter fetus subsp. venerealis cfvB10]OCS29450.1 C4-dicarboxylate ABC transporter [Campylobacter fetus subsp. venerealis LMG 6570 = CCUG 33900]OCS42522.1 C4-dicarboxylate ABC transporter [Campylobacter fetus subsp. venerealis cfvi02/298]AHE94942.1 anaerobic C4-dicarboxylate transp